MTTINQERLNDKTFFWLNKIDDFNTEEQFKSLLKIGVYNIVYGSEIDEIGVIEIKHYTKYFKEMVNEVIYDIWDTYEQDKSYEFDKTIHVDIDIFIQLVQQRLEYLYGIVTELSGNSDKNTYILTIL